jgi:hypothetical protein
MMMNSKKFPCKLENVPLMGELIIGSAERDIDDFCDYSTLFNTGYFETVKSKIEVCKELVEASTVTKELKFATNLLYDKSVNFRSAVSVLEDYLKLSADKLDVNVKNIGLKYVRTDITRRNIEGLLAHMQTSLVAVIRNLPVLEAHGLKQTLLDSIDAQLKEIGELNERRNALISKRNNLTVENIEKFSDLWNSLKLIMNVARTIYQGVDDVKLKDYTVAQLKKRINAER